MFGIGLQYSLVGKSNNSMVMDNMNGMDMVMPMFKISIPIFRKVSGTTKGKPALPPGKRTEIRKYAESAAIRIPDG